MSATILEVFIDVVAPVFGLVAIGYYLGPRLELQARTLSRAAFYFFVPAFVFDVISKASIEPANAARVTVFVVVTCAIFSTMGWGVAKLFRASREMTAAFVMTAVFGNVGNFGLALVNFRLGEAGLAPATLFFIIINIFAFGSCVVTAAWARGGGVSALVSVLKTPGLIAVIPAALVSGLDVEVPTTLARMVGLLSQAMIPVMLIALGVQLAEADSLKITREEIAATSIRLVGAPMVAWAVIGFFGLEGMDRAAGIIQCGMPVAVLVSIVAIEYGVAPTFVTATVFLSTLLSLPTLTILISLV